MFGTWKYDPATDNVEEIRRAFDPISARSSSHKACDRCHEKKLKCSGDKDGCDRCVAHRLACVYPSSSSKGSRRKPSPRASVSGSSSYATDSPRSPDSRSSGRVRSSRSHTSRRSGHTGSRSPLPPDGESAVDRLDYSRLGPQDGYDLNFLSTGTQFASSSSHSPTSYATSEHPLDYQSMPPTTYSQWSSSTPAYSSRLSTPSTSAYSSAGAHQSSYMSSAYSGGSAYPTYSQGDAYGAYTSTDDYPDLDPRYWPASSRP